jgi:hypothetical protein
LAAKIEFSYGAVQTVNLLALRLQWFESTPAHAANNQGFAIENIASKTG